MLIKLMVIVLILLDIVILFFVKDRGVKFLLLFADNLYLFIFTYYLFKMITKNNKVVNRYQKNR
jgi:hypothetical protein